MPPYKGNKGNKGNLMQHWTLCEVLRIAQRHHSALNYIDAHGMVPLATCRTGYDPVFDAVKDGLPNGKSAYEKAWYSLTKTEDGYPNSANFVRHVWKDRYSLFLCEKDPDTHACISKWLCELRTADPNCACAAARCGDWRSTLGDCLPRPADVGLPDDALTLVSFDPNKYNVRGRPRDADPDVYESDLRDTIRKLQEVNGSILIQLSTYSRGNRDHNPQGAVVSSVNSPFVEGGFSLTALVWTNRDMMSLIYARDVPWASCELAQLGQCFTRWLKP